MTAADVLTGIKISDVWAALGGGPLQRRRGRAFWRRGHGYNVSLDDAKGAWYDFRDNIGGGILDLVQVVHHCTRQDALRWLAEFSGVPLDDASLTEADRREYARRCAFAESEARELVWWRNGLLEVLRDHRDVLLRAYHNARRFLQSHSVDDCEARGDWRWEIAFDIQYAYWPRIADLDRRIDLLTKTSFAELLPYFRAHRRRAA
jgi:hypothetical protein